MRAIIRSLAPTLALVVVLVLVLDGLVQLVLSHGAPQGLRTFFDYGRSVPGKQALWRADPDLPGNLRAVAWRDAMMRDSARAFAAEAPGPVIRGYGMSFLNNILTAAQRVRPDLRLDLHAGPGAPGNATYAMFLDDRANRRAGDVVVLGILSDTLEGMFSLTNATWVFEQPAPFTYPEFRADPAGRGLIRLDPLVQSLADQDRLGTDPAFAAAWQAQLAAEDHAYLTAAFAWPWLDASPLARLLRRAEVMPALAARRQSAMAALSDPAGPGAEMLRRMAAEFAAMARADGQLPIVALIQGHRPAPDLAALLCPGLRAGGVLCFATAELQDPRDRRAFGADGHFRPEIDAQLGADFARLLPVPLP